MSDWVDFKALRKSLDFAAVLRFYKVELKPRHGGAQHLGFCPLPTHQGKRRSPSFSAKLRYGIWRCFGCGASGNVLEFATRMEGLDPGNPAAVRQAALKLQREFGIAANNPAAASSRKSERGDTKAAALKSSRGSIVVNAPLDFELKDLDRNHPYLRERGFTSETIEHFGLGYCNRGLLKGRIAMPLHDEGGRLVGYAGRLTDDRGISEADPKYRFPSTRERNGTILEFRKSLLLYNAHRINRPVDHLFVVEGFPATWWLWQAKLTNVVAVMGSSCSAEQGELIVERVKPDGKVWIVPDGNDAGIRCAHSIFEWVAPHRFVRWVRFERDEQPDDRSADDLLLLLNS